jgi:magnesium transporter
LRRDLLKLRRAVGPVVDVCRRLEHTDALSIDAAMKPLFRDVLDQAKRAQQDIDSLREILAFAFEASMMAGQSQQTEITRKLWCAKIRQRYRLELGRQDPSSGVDDYYGVVPG